METRSQTAFRWTVEGLFQRNESVYLWTLTMAEQIPGWWVPNTFDIFKRGLLDFIGKFEGVRVFEWHVNHGIHIHMLINRRVPVGVVRRIGKRYGFGRVHVVKADENAARYLGKYLCKDAGRLWPYGRQWASLGGRGVRVRDVQIETTNGKQYRQAVAFHRARGMTPYRAFQEARRDVNASFALDVMEKAERLLYTSQEHIDADLYETSAGQPF